MFSTVNKISCARIWPYKSINENALVLLKTSSLLPGIDIRQTKFIRMMNKEGFTKIVKFMTPGVGF